jgi:hypothetical protein
VNLNPVLLFGETVAADVAPFVENQDRLADVEGPACEGRTEKATADDQVVKHFFFSVELRHHCRRRSL